MPSIIVILLALPLAAVVLLIFLRRSSTFSTLVPALILSGITGAVLTSCFAFLASTIPIAPYEAGPLSWGPILGQLLLSLLIGFAMGTLVSAGISLPYWLISGRGRTRRDGAAPAREGDGPRKPAPESHG